RRTCGPTAYMDNALCRAGPRLRHLRGHGSAHRWSLNATHPATSTGICPLYCLRRLDALAWVHGLVLSAPRHLAGQPEAGGEQQGATIDDASSGHLCEDQISEYGGYNRRDDDVDQGIDIGIDRLQDDGDAEVGETCGDDAQARGPEHHRQFHAEC